MIDQKLSENERYKVDPRAQIAILLLFSSTVAILKNFQALIFSAFISILIITLSQISIKQVLVKLIPVNSMILFLWCFIPFTFKGKTIFSIKGLEISYEGILYAVQITIKSNAIMLMLIWLTCSYSIFTLGHAMHSLGIPKKLVHLFFFTSRYIPVIFKEYQKLLNSIKIRGFKPATNFHTYKTFAFLFGMVLIKSIERAQRVHNAMLCRGFKGEFYSLNEFHIKKNDIIYLIVMIALIICIGLLEWVIQLSI